MDQIRTDQILSFRPRKKQRIVRELHGVTAQRGAVLSLIGQPDPAPLPTPQ